MRGDGRPGTDLRALLERVESAAPTGAIEAVADELAAMVEARAVSFLIADFSGRALVRLGRAGPEAALGNGQGPAGAETVELAGTVFERVLRPSRSTCRSAGRACT